MGWLASRQTDDLGEDDEEEDGDEESDERDAQHQPQTGLRTGSVEDQILALPGMTPLAAATIPCAGFNGRCNKVADTCYSFWNGATLLVRV